MVIIVSYFSYTFCCSFQLVFKQKPSVLVSLCGAGPSRRRRQTTGDEPQYLDKNLMAEALNNSLAGINKVIKLHL